MAEQATAAKEAPVLKEGGKKAKTQNKSTKQVHLLKQRNGIWGGQTWCGIAFRHKKFFDNRVQANLTVADCEKCLKKFAEVDKKTDLKDLKEKKAPRTKKS